MNLIKAIIPVHMRLPTALVILDCFSNLKPTNLKCTVIWYISRFKISLVSLFPSEFFLAICIWLLHILIGTYTDLLPNILNEARH